MAWTPNAADAVGGVRAMPMGTVAAFAFCLAAALAPVLTVETPPLADYLDHLGRMHALADLGRDPLLAKFYAVRWAVLPNLAMDLMVPPLMRFMDVYAAGRLFLVAILTLLAGGAFAIHYALFRRANPFPFAGFLLLYNFAFLQGLVNYLMGVALALWAVAAWLGLRERSPWLRGAVSAVAAIVLFLCHLSALGIYGFALLCHEGWWLVRHRRLAWRRLAAEAAAFALPFLAVLPLLAASPTDGLAGDVDFDFPNKLEGLQWLFDGYWDWADYLWAGLVLTVLGGALASRSLRSHPAGLVFLAGGTLLYLAMPSILFDSWGADVRLPVGLLFVLTGFLRAEFPKPWQQRAFLGAVMALALGRFATVEAAWRSLDADLHDFRQSLHAIAPGSRVLLVEADNPGGSLGFNRPLSHASCLAMVERSSFVADAFTEPGKQVLVVRPEYFAQSNATDDDSPALSEILRARAKPGSAGDAYWGRWWTQFDYVYVVYSDRAAEPDPPGMRLLYPGRRFQLYKVATTG
ncbi:MAG: hypothetical protein M0006_08040 [Magnetospirillum sp.]|nr:hypothetical protein [Magnetospirillum sp.]